VNILLILAAFPPVQFLKPGVDPKIRKTINNGAKEDNSNSFFSTAADWELAVILASFDKNRDCIKESLVYVRI
jgi:hypothetical protein